MRRYVDAMERRYLNRVIESLGGVVSSFVFGYCPRCGDNFGRFTGLSEYRSDVLCDACLIKSLQISDY